MIAVSPSPKTGWSTSDDGYVASTKVVVITGTYSATDLTIDNSTIISMTTGDQYATGYSESPEPTESPFEPEPLPQPEPVTKRVQPDAGNPTTEFRRVIRPRAPPAINPRPAEHGDYAGTRKREKSPL